MADVTKSQPVIKLSFDLDDVPADRRGRQWHETLNQFFFQHENRTAPDFRSGRFSGCMAQDVRVATWSSDATHCRRSSSHVSKDGLDDYLIVTPTHGDFELSQRGRRVAIEKGRASLLALNDAFDGHQLGDGGLSGIVIPGSVLRLQRPDVDDYAARDLTSSGALQSIFVETLASFCRNADGIDAHTMRRVADGLVNLLSLMFEGADTGSAETTIQIAHRRRAQAIIERAFRDPGINVLSLAQELGLSERYVQTIFSASGETVSSAVRNRRMVEACRLLDRRGGSRASVANIAYMVGFTDPAHFSRVFRQQIGMSPGEWSTRPCA